MVKLKLFQIIHIILIFVGVIQCHFGLKLTNLKCASLNEKILQFPKCELKAVKRDIVELSLHIKTPLKPVNNVTLQLSLNRRGDLKSHPIFRYKINFCKFMSSTRRNPIAEMLFNVFQFLKYSNINHSCPYDHDFIIDRCRLDIKPMRFLSIAQGEYTMYTTIGVYAKPTGQKRHVKIRNFWCENLDEKFGNFIDCWVKPIKRDVSEINVHYKLKKIINDRFLINFSLKKRGNARIPILYNLTIDYCKFVGNRQKYRIFNIFFKILGFEDYSNFNHSCPYKEDFLLKGYRMDEKYISLFPIPYGEYVIELFWIYIYLPVIRNEISFQFYEKAEKPNRKVGTKYFSI